MNPVNPSEEQRAALRVQATRAFLHEALPDKEVDPQFEAVAQRSRQAQEERFSRIRGFLDAEDPAEAEDPAAASAEEHQSYLAQVGVTDPAEAMATFQKVSAALEATGSLRKSGWPLSENTADQPGLDTLQIRPAYLEEADLWASHFEGWLYIHRNDARTQEAAHLWYDQPEWFPRQVLCVHRVLPNICKTCAIGLMTNYPWLPSEHPARRYEIGRLFDPGAKQPKDWPPTCPDCGGTKERQDGRYESAVLVLPVAPLREWCYSILLNHGIFEGYKDLPQE